MSAPAHMAGHPCSSFLHYCTTALLHYCTTALPNYASLTLLHSLQIIVFPPSTGTQVPVINPL